MLKATRSDRPPVAKKEIRKKSNNRQRPKNFNSGYFKKYILYVIIFVLLLFFSFIFFCAYVYKFKSMETRNNFHARRKYWQIGSNTRVILI